MNSLPIVAVLLLPTAAPALSTDRLDEYVAQIQKARKSCGPTAVWYCLRRFGCDERRDELCRQADTNSAGTSLQSLLDLCRARGVNARVIQGVPANLESLPAPSILIVDERHCVVFEGLTADGQSVMIFEPTEGRRLTVSRANAEQHWTGQAIVFDRTAPSAQCKDLHA